MAMVFIYGPDSLQGRVYDRLGPSDVVGGALLDGYQLRFNKPNIKRPKEGLANLAPAEDGRAFGVVYDLNRRQLEIFEGYYGGYKRLTVQVSLLPRKKNDRPSAPVQATALVARRTDAALRPAAAALAETLKGAEENGAPKLFIERLHQIKPVAEEK
jgi:hypothetical protein